MRINRRDTTHGPLLTEATIQEIQLELIRRTRFNAFDGPRVLAGLNAHRNLWDAVLLDRFGIAKPGKLPMMGLIKLRDLPTNIWNVDKLFILTPNVTSAKKLTKIVKNEDWGGMVLLHSDREELDNALGGTIEPHAVVSIWWD